MLPARRIALTAGFTCQLFALRRADGMRTMPSAFKIDGSAAAATFAIIESPSVIAAMATALSAVATAVGSVAATMAVAAALGSKSSKQSFFL